MAVACVPSFIGSRTAARAVPVAGQLVSNGAGVGDGDGVGDGVGDGLGVAVVVGVGEEFPLPIATPTVPHATSRQTMVPHISVLTIRLALVNKHLKVDIYVPPLLL